MWYHVTYVCDALLWLSICALLCIVNTNEYMYLSNARKGPWLEKKTYSILFIPIDMIYFGMVKHKF